MSTVVEEIRAMRTTAERSNKLLYWQNWITLGAIAACIITLVLR